MIKKDLNLTNNQYHGLLLEFATFSALKQLGVEPDPLHNPFDDDYANDQHLKVDLIFVHDVKLFGVECKNLSHRSHVNLEFIDKEIIERFTNTDLPFNKRIVVFGKCTYQGDFPEDYDIIELQYQVNFNNIETSIELLRKLLSPHLDSMGKVCRDNREISFNGVIDCTAKGNLLHGVNTYNSKRMRLQRIDAKLRKEWNRLIAESRGIEVLDDESEIEGWID